MLQDDLDVYVKASEDLKLEVQRLTAEKTKAEEETVAARIEVKPSQKRIPRNFVCFVLFFHQKGIVCSRTSDVDGVVH